MSDQPQLPAPSTSRSDGFAQMVVLFIAVAVLLLIMLGSASNSAVPSMADKTKNGPSLVYFIEPQDGATVPQTFPVVMAAEGLNIEPAGEIVEGSGHFHILVNEDFVPVGEIVPLNTENYLHFGQAQTETEVTLAPGEYTLRLQFADGAHQAYDSAEYGDEIHITVE